MLAYCYFDKSHIGKTLKEVLVGNSVVPPTRKEIVNKDARKIDYYATFYMIEGEYEHHVKDYEIVDILDYTNKSGKDLITGFYGIAFGKKDENGEYSNIVLAFRGTQLYPIKDAYVDFFENDLMIGLGKKPKQFDHGLEFYESLIRRFDYNIISLVGHSLGGGIAQFVSAMSYKLIEDYEFCPKVITFNSIGILVEKMITLEDFIDLDKDIRFDKEIVNNNLEKISDIIFSYLEKKLSKYLIELPESPEELDLTLSDFDSKTLYGQLKLINIFKMEEEIINDVLTNLINKNSIYEELKLAKKTIDRFKENRVFIDKISNFTHSKDFTAQFFPHIGKTFYIDLMLDESPNNITKKFNFSLSIFKTMISRYHLADVFIPFIGTIDVDNLHVGNAPGNFTKTLSSQYISSAIRKMIYNEENLNNELLIYFYNLKRELNSEDVIRIKNYLVEGLTKSDKLFNYSDKMIIQLKEMEDFLFLKIWGDAIDRLASPFEKKDIYDNIIYIKRKLLI